jgi:rubrerythrin
MHTQSVDDILRKAVEVEKSGADFYRKLANGVNVAAVKDVFLGLVADEVRHQRDFMSLSASMKGVVIESSVDILEVMNVASQNLVEAMKGAEPVSINDVNFSQAVKIGIHSEQAAIQVYSSLLGISHPEFKRVVVRVLEEERKHLAALEGLKKERLG